MSQREIYINDHFYDLFFDDDFDILLCIGSYGSGKSHSLFDKLVSKAVAEKRRIAVIRETYASHRDSTYEDIKDAFDRLGVIDQYEFLKSPLYIYHKSDKNRTIKKHSEILFRGADDQRKIKAIKNIDYILVEEANQVDYNILKELMGRLRTDEIKTHFVMLTNPGLFNDPIDKLIKEWGFDLEELYEKKQLSKTIQVDVPGKGTKDIKIKLHHSTYKDNVYNSAQFIQTIEGYKDPDMIQIAKLGRYGITEGKLFTNLHKQTDVWGWICNSNIDFEWYNGQDYGFSGSYDCLVKMAVDREANTLYIYNAIYNKGLGRDELIAEMKKILMRGELVVADCADPRLISDLDRDPMLTVERAKKGPGSVAYGLSNLREFDKIVIDDKLEQVWRDFDSLARLKRPDGSFYSDRYNIDPHAVDSARYGLEKFERFEEVNYNKNKPNGW